MTSVGALEASTNACLPNNLVSQTQGKTTLFSKKENTVFDATLHVRFCLRLFDSESLSAAFRSTQPRHSAIRGVVTPYISTQVPEIIYKSMPSPNFG
jgi:hypothetical protein